MANRLKMANIQAILQLHALQWSGRRIAQHLGLDRGTVAKVLRQAQPDPKPAKTPFGSEGSKPATLDSVPGPALPAPSEPTTTAPDSSGDPNSKPAKAPSGFIAGIRTTTVTTGPMPATAACVPDESSGDATTRSRSACEWFRELILAKLEDELSAQRIYQDLVANHGYAGSYYSVRRFVQKLEAHLPLPFRRMECAPGFEAQVDYGTGAPIIGSDGKRRKSHVFRVVLSHSRKGYCEASFRQTTDDFIRALENAFWSFGGVPQTVVIDNLKAAVKHADWYDPELQPKLRVFCQHYGTAILPTRPYTPRHKGKIERGIDYVKDNALKGETFTTLEKQNAHLTHWEQTIADTRLHGTTRQQVRQVFEDVERRALRPLPIERFAFFHEAQRIVSRDGHVEVAKAFYSVPPEYLTRTVWVRWDARLVRVFDQRMEQIALHVRHEPGRFSTNAGHIAAEKISGLERGVAWLMSKIRLIGSQTTAWAEAMLCARGIEGTRVLMGVMALTKKHSSAALENACKTALSHGEFRLRVIRALIARQPHVAQGALPFLETHPLIRPLDDYAHVVAAALARKDAAESPVPGGISNNDREVRFEKA
jgi:transposase